MSQKKYHDFGANTLSLFEIVILFLRHPAVKAGHFVSRNEASVEEPMWIQNSKALLTRHVEQHHVYQGEKVEVEIKEAQDYWHWIQNYIELCLKKTHVLMYSLRREV